MTIVATVLAIALPAPAAVCDQAHPVACIDAAAARWSVSGAVLRRKAWCESRMNPMAVGRAPVGRERALGLFQFLPSTWRTTPYRGRWIFSARYSSLAAAWMHRVGRGGEWACA